MENAFMEMMADNLGDTDLHPKVGIFWYSVKSFCTIMHNA